MRIIRYEYKPKQIEYEIYITLFYIQPWYKEKPE